MRRQTNKLYAGTAETAYAPAVPAFYARMSGISSLLSKKRAPLRDCAAQKKAAISHGLALN